MYGFFPSQLLTKSAGALVIFVLILFLFMKFKSRGVCIMHYRLSGTAWLYDMMTCARAMEYREFFGISTRTGTIF